MNPGDLPLLENFLSALGELWRHERVQAVLAAALVLMLGWLLARWASRLVLRVASPQFRAQHRMLTSRAVYWVLLGLAGLSSLHTAGVEISVLLGAAGFLTVALGFAAQTSTSNLISGLFLIGERPFELGDIIKVGTTVGTVQAIDLLSVKLCTFDNLFVRIPNETLLKSEIINYTRFPIRRIDLLIGVAYKEDLSRVEEVLFQVAESNPQCLDEPTPLLQILAFGDSSINLQFSVWALREEFLKVRNQVFREIKVAFDETGIEIPFPQRTLHLSKTEFDAEDLA